MNPTQQATAARQFALRWQNRGYEKGESQSFWLELLSEVFGVEHPASHIRFEQQVRLDHTAFIDAFIPSTHVMIEQKSASRRLDEGLRQSDGTVLSPFQQAKRYSSELPYSQRPRWIVTCNFCEFWVYDMEHPGAEPEKIHLADLAKEIYRLQFLVDSSNDHVSREMEVSIKAGEIVGLIYDELLKQYSEATRSTQPTDSHILRSLNILCVRLVFCLYAEDAGFFGPRTAFHDYLFQYPAKELRRALIDLFHVLDTPIADRDPYMNDDLRQFPYVNGGLFSDKQVVIPQFSDELKFLLLKNASSDFDWSEISPTIFGAVFESTLNPSTRRSGGMHYTSIENIHKVIDPLFLDGLRREFDGIVGSKETLTAAKWQKLLEEFQTKLASLTFLDPACGSGNFLTETYLSLRRIENEVINARYHGQSFVGIDENNPVKVSINQFYGIEINDFAVTVATTALWISEAQMLRETERIIHHDIDFLPLKNYANIREGNALRMDWDEIEIASNIPTIHARNVHLIIEPEPAKVGDPAAEYGEVNVVAHHFDSEVKSRTQRYQVSYDYIIGNPPFVGARMMNDSQKQDVRKVFGSGWPNVGNLDYVCCWYKKAANLMAQNNACCTAFVSTNSVCQGEQVANLWEKLFAQGIRINFAHRTFRWDSEASLKAHVHCVVVGFSYKDVEPRTIFDRENTIQAQNINAYLLDAPDVFVGSRQHPLCNVPEIGIGNKPIDGGNYLFTYDEMKEFVRAEPMSAQYFHPWYGAEEFIYQKPRYCLWLGDCTPAELRRMPHCLKRVEAVRNARLASKSVGTRKLADRPTRFHVENMPQTNYLLVPSTSSERRPYVPIGFMTPDIIASNANLLIPDATLYHFGILTSSVHMAWIRAVCGRLESRYRYSKDIVYNNFPWPEPTESQKARIEQTAQAILDARALYPDSSLADLYDERTMPHELRRAHRDNDRAVLQLYSLPTDSTDEQTVAHLFSLYVALTEQPN